MKKADIFIQSKAESWRDLIFQKNFPNGSVGKESTCNARDTGDSRWILSLGRSAGGRNGDPLEHFAWKIPWTEKPGGLQSKSHKELDDWKIKQTQ